MDFLTFLVQKLWQNKQKLNRETPINDSAYSSKNWGLLTITLAPETPGSQSRTLKTHYSLGSTQTLSHNFGDDVIKVKPKLTLPSPWQHPPKTPNPNLKSFLVQWKLQDFTSLSKVRIALHHVLGASNRYPPVGDSCFFCNFLILGKMGFWTIILVPDMLEGQSRALKTRMIV